MIVTKELLYLQVSQFSLAISVGLGGKKMMPNPVNHASLQAYWTYISPHKHLNKLNY